jgi:hypothetical protein
LKKGVYRSGFIGKSLAVGASDLSLNGSFVALGNTPQTNQKRRNIMEKGLSLAELESEHAEYLPAREVMCCWHGGAPSNHATVANGNGNGNTYQEGLVNVSALNGNLNGNGNLTGIFQ